MRRLVKQIPSGNDKQKGKNNPGSFDSLCSLSDSIDLD